jgi:hypothetical protein
VLTLEVGGGERHIFYLKNMKRCFDRKVQSNRDFEQSFPYKEHICGDKSYKSGAIKFTPGRFYVLVNGKRLSVPLSNSLGCEEMNDHATRHGALERKQTERFTPPIPILPPPKRQKKSDSLIKRPQNSGKARPNERAVADEDSSF